MTKLLVLQHLYSIQRWKVLEITRWIIRGTPGIVNYNLAKNQTYFCLVCCTCRWWLNIKNVHQPHQQKHVQKIMQMIALKLPHPHVALHKIWLCTKCARSITVWWIEMRLLESPDPVVTFFTFMHTGWKHFVLVTDGTW